MDIGLNSDMGEGFGPYRVGEDEALMKLVSSANIACGFHAGDPSIMASMVRHAKSCGVEIGAHPGLPDRQGFGRRVIPMEADEMVQQVLYQLGALQAIAAAEGTKLTHLSFHAAMGNMVCADAALADRVLGAVRAVDRELVIYGMPDTEAVNSARRLGMRTVSLFLADRAYDERGELVPRRKPNSVFTDHAHVASRVAQFLDDGSVTPIEGKRIKVRAQAILVHSDTPGALGLAKTVRDVVERGGGRIVPPSHLCN
jgi:UPF0271 protein